MDSLINRLRGKYAMGPHLPNGKPEFGFRQFEAPPIQHEAADRIEELETQLAIANEGLTAAYMRGAADARERATRDQKAAVAQARADGMREAAEIARLHISDAHGGMFNVGRKAASDVIYHRILAAIEGEG